MAATPALRLSKTTSTKCPQINGKHKKSKFNINTPLGKRVAEIIILLFIEKVLQFKKEHTAMKN
jgi:hypothetical protein